MTIHLLYSSSSLKIELFLRTHTLQVVVQYETEQLDLVLDCLERTTAHLTAAIVSKDTQFQNKVRPSLFDFLEYFHCVF